MTLIKYRPTLSLLESLQRDLNDVFNPNASESFEGSQWEPRIDIKEEAKQYVILADIPGVDPNKIEMSLDERTLTIKGEKTIEKEDNEDNYSRTERFYGSFVRQLTMPNNIDSSNITATGKHGVLKICVPKRETSISKSIKVISEDYIKY